ncbi:T9SS type A sorting domain-containing protein [Thermoproteota archaeon]
MILRNSAKVWITSLVIISSIFSFTLASAQELEVEAASFLSVLGPYIVEGTGDLNLLGLWYYFDGSSQADDFDPSVTTLTKRPLFYPNPFRLTDGSILYYELSANQTIEIRIFNIRGQQVFSTVYPAGTNGGSGGIGVDNQVAFGSSNIGNLPAGIYFFILMGEGKVIGKGKFAIIP